ncbi:MAG: GAF domain-containing SpoIIE family protein phosphatase [Candidatus Zixiibacteriota bacterium]
MTWHIAIAVLYFALGAVLVWLGAVILRENPRSRINRVTALMLLLAGLGPVFASVGRAMETQGPPSPISSVPFPYSLFYIWELFFPQLLLFALVFPSERRWVSRFPRLKFLIYAPYVFHVVWVAFLARPGYVRLSVAAESDLLQALLVPLNMGLRFLSFLLALLFDVHVKFFSLINLVYIVAAVWALRGGYKEVTNRRIRDQVRIIIRGIRVAVGLYAIAFIAPTLGIVQVAAPLREGLTVLALLVGSASIAWSIIRYQFLDIRLIVRQSVVFTVTSALLVGVYLLLVTEVSTIVKKVLEVETPAIDIAFVVLVLLFFQPVKQRADNLITRLFLRDQADPRTILESFSAQIASVFEVPDLKQRMLSVVTEQMLVEQAFFAVRHPNENRFVLELAGLQGETLPANDTFFLEAQRRGRPTVFEDFVVDQALTPVTEILGRWGCRLVVPIVERGTLTAVLFLGEKISGYRYMPEDANLLATLANQMAVAMTNAGLYREALEKQKLEDELDVARRIQMRLLPRQMPCGPDYHVAAFTQPSRQVGGDYYDFFPSPDGRLGLVIADVSGKGLGAALLVSQLQAILKSEVRGKRSLRECVANANVLIAEATSPEQFATLVYAEFDPKTRVLSYTNAGHNYPILVRADGRHEHLDSGGLVLGVLRHAVYEVGQVHLQQQDTVFFYTDGLCDLQNPAGDDFGERRILELVRDHRHLTADGLKDEVVRQVTAFAAGERGGDDLTVMVLKAAPPVV